MRSIKMREIKFRGKRVDGKGWAYGSLIIELNLPELKSIYSDIRNSGKSKYLIYPIDAKDGRAKEVIPETVGQYTGLKDKDGVEIYDGDIVNLADGQVVQAYPIPSAFKEILFREDEAKFYWVDTNTKKSTSGYTFCKTNAEKFCKVIGNIYENPDLTKEPK